MKASEIFVERGYAGTTVKDIVESAGISTGSFYFYFKSKEELFEQIYDDFICLLEETSEFAINHPMGIVEGFCRSKASEMWIFQRYRQAAKIMLIEAVGLNTVFEQKRAELYRRSNQRITEVFDRIHSGGQLLEYDSKTFAVICNGTMYNVIIEWLQEGVQGNITDYIYPVVIYNLNAFCLEYDKEEVITYIRTMTAQMEDFINRYEKENGYEN